MMDELKPCKNCERTKDQNIRMRNWFEQRTGLDSKWLYKHMKCLDNRFEMQEKLIERQKMALKLSNSRPLGTREEGLSKALGIVVAEYERLNKITDVDTENGMLISHSMRILRATAKTIQEEIDR